MWRQRDVFWGEDVCGGTFWGRVAPNGGGALVMMKGQLGAGPEGCCHPAPRLQVFHAAVGMGSGGS